jgi:cytoskeletal protein CcmA (bactofilin family)
MTRRRLVLSMLLLVFLLASTIGVVLAQTGQLGGKLQTGSEVTIPAGETVDHDLYAFAGSVVVNGTVTGDIVAAGGNIDVNGAVTGDVLAAGGRINVNGPVTGDVRAAGGQISVGGNVTEDVMAAGGQVTVGGTVGQDLIASTGQLTLSGTVAGSAVGSVGAYSKTGSVAGTDSISVTGNQAAVAVAPSNPVLDAIRHFIVVLILAFVAMLLAPRVMQGAEAWVRERPLPVAGWGAVAFIGYFVLVIVLLIVVILLAILFGALGFGAVVAIDVFGGLVLIAGVTLAFIVVVAFLADAIVGLALARLVVAQTGRGLGGDRWSQLGWLAVGVAIVVVLTSLPIIGGIFKLGVVLLGLGAVWMAWRQWRSGPTGAAPTAAGAGPEGAPPPPSPAVG